MSKKFSKVKNYFDSGRWSIARVKLAVEKGWITEEECEAITGESYADEEKEEAEENE